MLRRLSALTALDFYVGAIAVIGLAVVGASLVALPSTPHVAEWVLFSGLALVSGRFALKIPAINARFSVSDTFFVASAVLFGPAPAVVTISVDSLVMSIGRGYPVQRYLFNGSAPAVAFWVGAQAFFALLGEGPLYGTAVAADRIVLPLALLSATYFLLNSGLTAVAIALEKRLPAFTVWRRHFAVVSLNYFAAASSAFFLFVIVHHLSLIALSAVIPLYAVIHLAMRSYTGRLEDATAHVATVDRLYLSTIEALSTAIEAKDGVTSSHIHRVQHYAMGLAGALGVTDEQTLKAIQAAALLHDTGKLAVPERILNKPGKLTAAEFEAMKLHVDVGADILSSIDFPYPVVPIVRAHHENWDGSGYPRGLRGEDIPIGARILSVVDCYDALTSDRPYRAALTDEQAFDIIRARRGTMYEPRIVDMFEQVCRDIRPATVQAPELQKALLQISQTVDPVPAAASSSASSATGIVPADAPDGLMALVNLARIVERGPSVGDVASIAWAQLRPLAPGASCAVFLADKATDSVVVRFAAGPAAQVLHDLQIKVGDRLSGWVAGNPQPIVNSEASLDLGHAAEVAQVSHCLAVPLQQGGEVVGVLSLYAAEAFREDVAQSVQAVAPALAQMFAAIDAKRAKPSAVRSRSAAALRAVG